MSYKGCKFYNIFKNSFDYQSLTLDKKTEASSIRMQTNQMIKTIKNYKSPKITKTINKTNIFKNYKFNDITTKINSDLFYKTVSDKNTSSYYSPLQSKRSNPIFIEKLKLSKSSLKKTSSKFYLNTNIHMSYLLHKNKKKLIFENISKIFPSPRSDNSKTLLRSSLITNYLNSNNNNLTNKTQKNSTNNTLGFGGSFITSISNKKLIQRTHYVDIREREENVSNFWETTKKLALGKYFLNLKRAQLLNLKEFKENELDIEKLNYKTLVKNYNLLKLYNINLNKYMEYLRLKIEKENQLNEKLLNEKDILISELQIKTNQLDKTVNKFKEYLNDKLFLLCVKNSTTDIKKFCLEDQLILQQDFANFKYFRNYLWEFVEIQKTKNLSPSQLYVISEPSPPKRQSLIKSRKKMVKQKLTKRQSIYSSFDDCSIRKTSKDIQFECEPVFESVEDFINKVKNLPKNVEDFLSKELDKRDEVKKLYKIYLEQKQKLAETEETDRFFMDKYMYLEKIYSWIKEQNSQLILFKKSIILKKIKKSFNVCKKIKYIIEDIQRLGVKKINALIDKDNINIYKPLIMLKGIEKILNFLIEYKEKEKEKNYERFMLTLKKTEVDNKIYKLRKHKKEEENKRKIRYMEILEKNDKILFLPKKPISNKIYQSFSCKKNKKSDYENKSKNQEIFDVDF